MNKPKIVWLATTDIKHYSNPTEPSLYPNAFTALVEKTEYDALATKVFQLEKLANWRLENYNRALNTIQKYEDRCHELIASEASLKKALEEKS